VVVLAMRRLLLLALCCGGTGWTPACRATTPRYLLSRAEPYAVQSDGMVMLHYDL
jgi:hypothetical protein